MSYARAGALNKYSQVAVDANATYGSPHRLIQMLLEGAMEKIATAKGCMARNQIAEKGRHIGWAVSIIGGLRASLAMDAGGEIAHNLDNLYEYMERRLLHANLHNDAGVLDEVTSLLREIKSAWDAIPEEAKRDHAQATAPAPGKLAVGAP